VDATVLRGASVAVDVPRVGRVLAAAALAALAAVVAILFWAGARHNSRITALREEGVAVTATVSQCRGLMGGSGSNAAGYNCTGTFSLGGHRFDATLPDGALHARGSTVQLVTVPGDPTLVATSAAVRSERASDRVYVVPAVLLVLLVALSAGGVAVLRSTAYTARSLPAVRSAAPTAP
jgi:hypothetical protein